MHHPDDPSSLSGNSIIRIFIDRSEKMWLATSNGLDRFDPSTGKFATYKRDSQSGAEHYFDIDEDSNGNLWLGGPSGLQYFDPATGRFTGYQHRLDDPHSLSDNRVTSVHVDHAGTVWAATESGLDKLNLELLTRLQASGEAYLSNAVVHGKFALRACIVNFRTSLTDVEALLPIVVRMGGDVDLALRPGTL